MRKFLIFYVILMVIIFLTPNLFLIGSIKARIEINSGDNENNSNDKVLDVSDDKIKLLLTAENKVIELDFDDYIKGVLIRRSTNNL